MATCPPTLGHACSWSLTPVALLARLARPVLCASSIVALELTDRYEAPLRPLRLPAPLQAVVLALRAIPSALLSAAMLPHQTCTLPACARDDANGSVRQRFAA